MTLDLPPFTVSDLIRLAPPVPKQVEAREASPDVGEVWLLRWDAEAEFGIVVAGGDPFPDVVPIVFDGVLSADERFVVDVPAIGKGVALSHLHRPVPTITFDVTYGSVSSGSRIPIDGRATVLREVETETARAFLKLADWQPAATEVDLLSLLRASGAPPAEMASAFGMSPGEVLRLLRGTFIPAAAQAELIAARLRISTDSVLAGALSIPTALRHVISRREFREPIRALAKLRSQSNTATWNSLAHGVLSPQYRQKREAEDIDWEARARHWLETNL